MEQPAVNIRQIYYSLLRRCYTSDERLFVDSFVLKHSLTFFIEETLQQVEHLAELSNKAIPVDLNEIKTLSYETLKTFNTAVATMQDQEEKERVKNLLSKFANLLQMEISQRTSLNFPEVTKSIKEGLKQAVHTEKYNKSDFKQHFPSHDINITDSVVTVELETEKKEYLVWDDSMADLEECIRLIIEQYFYIKSANDFKKIFNDPYCDSQLKIEDGKINHMILLFERLWDEDIIILKGKNGFWLLLERRLVDFQKKPFDFPFRKRAYNLNNKFSIGANIIKELDQIVNRIKK